MKAFVLSEEGPRIVECATPRLRPDALLVRVRACALNRVDLMMARGHVHGGAGGLGAVLGVEWAGEVVEVGPEVTRFAPGDRVMCSGAGAFAELAVCSAGRALPIPRGTSDEQAAALPVALQTMHDALVTNGQLAPGDAVLVQGASSGVGLMALAIAKLRGARFVCGSSTDAGRRARLREHGADLAVDSRDERWVEQVIEATGGRGVDVVIDQVSGPLLNATMRATRVGGRIVNVGRLGGMRAELDCDLHALRRIHYVGVTFRTRSVEEVHEIVQRVERDLGPALADGALRLPIDRVFGLEQLPEALAYVGANRHFGKVVLRV